jgi:cell fate regulator YaaT (PSP1 superfamily)
MKDDKYAYIKGSGHLTAKSCSKQDNKLNAYDWLVDVPENIDVTDMVEVQFKNTRKGYFKNSNKLPLEKGDIVAVEASPGHDIGRITMTGKLVELQMKKARLRPDLEIKRVYRKARPVDLEKYEQSKAKEHDTMIRSRQIAADLKLEMKIGDVEYQGDGNKAIFYYIADGRVDFRQLIKVLAEAFRVRIEMKQIGARQEAGRIGGFGPCGRELCCASWMRNFISVSTNAARIQDISLNPQKLAGQCAKLKCCLNYEIDQYVEASKRLPSKEIELITVDSTYYFFKADILKQEITYSTDKNFLANAVTISSKRAFEVLNSNKKGEKPERLKQEIEKKEVSFVANILNEGDLNRFDKNDKNKRRRKKRIPNNANNNNNEKGKRSSNRKKPIKMNNSKEEDNRSKRTKEKKSENINNNTNKKDKSSRNNQNRKNNSRRSQQNRRTKTTENNNQ